MKKGITYIAGIALLILAVAPVIAFAASNPIKSNVFDPTILNGPLVTCVGAPAGNGGANTNSFPVCQNLCDLVSTIANVIYFVIAVVLWIITPIMFLIGGLLFMIGGSSPERLGTAKKMITGALWGIAITLCAWLIVFSFIAAIGNLGKYVGGFGGGKSNCTLQSGSVGANVPGSLTGSVD